MDKSKLLFLLGGADLEMQTIRDTLQAEAIPFVDHHLRWDNALLSSYQKELQLVGSGCTVYGIELQEDMIPPVSYRPIDHHNQLSSMPCALEQVMEILQLPMTRYLKLIAANDKAYIPGMLAMGATVEEISAIRLADRKAQGVTEEEEVLAQKAIDENLEKIGGMLVVRTDNSSFSPICDRLYPYRELLVYTDCEWVYYGERAEQIRMMFPDDCASGNLYYGGGENGYVGIKKNTYSSNGIYDMVCKIMKR